MKSSELLKELEAGKVMLVGTFVHGKKEQVKYRDRSTGKPATFDKVEYAVLGATGIVFVQPDTRKIEGFNFETFVPPFKPNSRVVVVIEALDVERGVTVIRGTVQELV